MQQNNEMLILVSVCLTFYFPITCFMIWVIQIRKSERPKDDHQNTITVNLAMQMRDAAPPCRSGSVRTLYERGIQPKVI